MYRTTTRQSKYFETSAAAIPRIVKQMRKGQPCQPRMHAVSSKHVANGACKGQLNGQHVFLDLQLKLIAKMD